MMGVRSTLPPHLRTQAARIEKVEAPAHPYLSFGS